MMLRVAAFSVVLFALGCASVPTEDASTDEGRQVQSIVRNTLSPFCPGKTLNSCPSPKAGEWRRDIRDWVEAGVPEPEIRDRLQSRVPTFDLSIPPVKSGWVIPVVAVVLSTLWFVVMVRKFRGRGPKRRPLDVTKPDQDLDTRLDQELAALDG
jgi:cytochrome c-type biogenesis protein CcmH/NrfF